MEVWSCLWGREVLGVDVLSVDSSLNTGSGHTEWFSYHVAGALHLLYQLMGAMMEHTHSMCVGVGVGVCVCVCVCLHSSVHVCVCVRVCV